MTKMSVFHLFWCQKRVKNVIFGHFCQFTMRSKPEKCVFSEIDVFDLALHKTAPI